MENFELISKLSQEAWNARVLVHETDGNFLYDVKGLRHDMEGNVIIVLERKEV